jgi:hypothetical protein
MKSFLLLFGFVFITNISKCQTSIPNDTIHWDENRKLRIEDFKGEPMTFTGLGGEAFCINYAYFERPSLLTKTMFHVIPVFDRTKSWLTTQTDKNCLLYFQVMFNLYELHARKLRKDLSEQKFGMNPNDLFQSMYNNSMTNLTNEYNNFRKETKMGLDIEALKLWDKKVYEQLDEFAAYKK